MATKFIDRRRGGRYIDANSNETFITGMIMATTMTENDSKSARFEAGSAPRPKLIVIDESRLFSAFIAEVAEALGYQVETAAQIGEVMQACRLESPEMVLIGHISPDVDGLELVTWLCQDSSIARLLVLTDGTKRYSNARRLVAGWGASLTFESHPRALGPKALRAALAPRTPITGATNNVDRD